MSRRRNKKSDSHPWHFSTVDMQDMAQERAKWLDYTTPLDFLSVDLVRRAHNECTRGAWAQIQWIWEQLEPADAILATCVERRLGALKAIPWDIVKKDGLSDAEDLLAEAQMRTLQDFANAIENLDEAIIGLAQASFRHYRHIQLLETEEGGLRLNVTNNWNWARDGYAGEWQWNPAATYGLTKGVPLPVNPESIISRICPRPIDHPAMMLCLDRRNAKAQWLVFNNRYGVPPAFAIMPAGVDEAMRKEYIKFAMQCVSNAAGVLPAGSDVRTVTPGSTGPDTFSRLLEVSNQELVLRATGGLLTMLTAPGAGTNTATGSAHQSAFDELAANEAEQIANLLQERLFAPVLDQWHPGQPHLVEFVMRRPDSDNAAASVQNIATLAASGYRTPDEQVAELTGLNVETAQQPAMPQMLPPALNSLHTRYAPLMLYPPARAAFERALNMAAAPPMTGGERAAIAPMDSGRISPDLLARRANMAYTILRRSVQSQIAAQNAEGEQEEVATNFNPNHGDNGQFTSGAGRHRAGNQRATKGNPRNPTTKSNTPLKAAPGAKPQTQVNATEHAMKSTRKGGKVQNVAKIGGKSLTIESGVVGKKRKDFKGGHGVVHQQAKHGDGTKENTTLRTAAKALVHGEMTYDAGNGTYQHAYGRHAAYTAPNGNNTINFITAHRRNKPKAKGDKKEPQS